MCCASEPVSPSIGSFGDGGRHASCIFEASGEGSDDDIGFVSDAVSRVENIITKATDQLIVEQEPCRLEVGRGGSSCSTYTIPDDVQSPSPPPASATAAEPLLSPARAAQAGSAPQQRATRTRMGTGAACNPLRCAEIAQILRASRRPSEVREYASNLGYGRVPQYLRQVAAELDAEQRYIVRLREQPSWEEAPKAAVRLLVQGEKDELLRGLKQQFQQMSAQALKADKADKLLKADLETQMERIRKDITSVSRPYIFVEVGS